MLAAGTALGDVQVNSRLSREAEARSRSEMAAAAERRDDGDPRQNFISELADERR
jgi:hypothetical protein